MAECEDISLLGISQKMPILVGTATLSQLLGPHCPFLLGFSGTRETLRSPARPATPPAPCPGKMSPASGLERCHTAGLPVQTGPDALLPTELRDAGRWAWGEGRLSLPGSLAHGGQQGCSAQTSGRGLGVWGPKNQGRLGVGRGETCPGLGPTARRRAVERGWRRETAPRHQTRQTLK